MLPRVKHIKKDDMVVALSGSYAGKFGKVLEVKQAKGLVKVEGLGTVKRHTKPTQGNPKGGIIEKLKWMPASVFQACNDSGKALGRVGFEVSKDGAKKKTYKSGAASKKGK